MNNETDCDILLLLEGTYPYIKGGVSSWVHQIVSGLPHWRFGGVFIGSRRQDYAEIQYQLPANFVTLSEHYLFDETPGSTPLRPPRLPADAQASYVRLHESLRRGESGAFDPEALLEPGSALREAAFLHGDAAWRYITQCYETGASEPSFLDYFWTVRNLHKPLWTLAEAARTLPRTRLLFSPSTGYAGLLGVFGAQRQECPLVLMEHGIYTKERRIDLMNADWIADTRNPLLRDPTEVSHLREMWVRFFEALGRQAYARADPIVSLFGKARQQQIHDGADPQRTRIIPNGVDVAGLRALRRPTQDAPPAVIGLLGRVVPIKDIKTFIRAAHRLRERLPEAQAWIIGPEDEDPEYSRECHDLARALDLGDALQFLGFQRIHDILPKIGVLVLSSISEGLPLSVLEGFSAGLPSVTTDVGACSELIYGREGDAADRALGAAGAVVGLADHEALAERCAELLEDQAHYAAAVRAATARVERYYDRPTMLDTFDALFAQKLTTPTEETR
ncbi:GT4 family glycosyltransferase PelF [Acidihalobacter ferrooxydans]|uniref:Glycosyl transferase family 1 n=1 Tax=Acidihalobacter ferrooxydans TaxID=1765967 RepID=A0A1P8UHV1_9GAMM|nr:GT4 family glycosyltransferase PelF [Acidihalobacter ferrooxydans]APZ43397.1 hypothetical protein BW247_10090 [Acidihalobacter ferrooxydans]